MSKVQNVQEFSVFKNILVICYDSCVHLLFEIVEIEL